MSTQLNVAPNGVNALHAAHGIQMSDALAAGFTRETVLNALANGKSLKDLMAMAEEVPEGGKEAEIDSSSVGAIGVEASDDAREGSDDETKGEVPSDAVLEKGEQVVESVEVTEIAEAFPQVGQTLKAQQSQIELLAKALELSQSKNAMLAKRVNQVTAPPVKQAVKPTVKAPAKPVSRFAQSTAKMPVAKASSGLRAKLAAKQNGKSSPVRGKLMERPKWDKVSAYGLTNVRPIGSHTYLDREEDPVTRTIELAKFPSGSVGLFGINFKGVILTPEQWASLLEVAPLVEAYIGEVL